MNKRQAKKYYKKLEDTEKLVKWKTRYISSYMIFNKVHHRTIKCQMHQIVPELSDYLPHRLADAWYIIVQIEQDAPTLARKLRHDYQLRLNDPALRMLCRRCIQHGITKH